MSEEKKTFLQKMSEQILKLDTQLDELKGKSGKITDGLKEEYKDQIDKLSSKKNDLKNKLNEFKDSGGDAWGSIKDGLESAAKELKNSFSDAISKFKDKEETTESSESSGDTANETDKNKTE